MSDKPKSRLLLIPCSDTKRQDPDMLPALERYDGPIAQQVRKADLADINVCILSARYGLIRADTPIPAYDARMTAARAEELLADGVHTMPDYMHDRVSPDTPYRVMRQLHYSKSKGYYRTPYSDVCVVPFGAYAQVLRDYVDGAQREGLIASVANITFTIGGLLAQRRQLGEWLRNETLLGFKKSKAA